MKKLNLISASVSLLALGSVLTGCSTGFVPDADAPQVLQGTPLSGSTYGGQSPIYSSHVYLYAVGTPATTSSTTNAVSLLKSASNTAADSSGNYYVTTDTKNGGFNITGDYTCTSGQMLYLYSVGGNVIPIETTSGSTTPTTTSNTMIGEMSVLGDCANLSKISFIYMNEVSTVAAAYAMGGIATSPTLAYSDGTTLAQTGVANAFNTAANLYNIQAAGSSGRTTTVYGNGVVPQTKLNFFANALAACINSSGSSSTQCQKIQTLKTAGQNGTTPTDTAIAAFNAVHIPAYSASVLYGVSPTQPPFSPTLTSQPNDMTLAIVYKGNGLGTGIAATPHSLAVDGSGNVWVTNATGNEISEFSPVGAPVGSSPFVNNGLADGTNLGLDSPYAVAIDNAGRTWVANHGSSGTMSVLNADGSNVTNAPFSTGSTSSTGTTGTGNNGCNAPVTSGVKFDGLTDIAIGLGGNAYVTSGTRNAIAKISGTGSLQNYCSGITNSVFGLNVPTTITILPTSGNVWVAGTNGNGASQFNYGLNFVSNYGTATQAVGSGLDASDNVWITQANGTVDEISPGGGNNTRSGGALYSSDGLAFDGGGDIWAADTNVSTILEANTTPQLVSSTAGFTPSPAATPNSIAVDGSGNIWYNTSTDATLRELVGAGTATITPLIYAVTYNKLATKP